MSSKQKNPLDECKRIERELRELGRQLRDEHRVAAAELADRLRLGLTGEDAVRHYNDWMKKHGLGHLCVEQTNLI